MILFRPYESKEEKGKLNRGVMKPAFLLVGLTAFLTFTLSAAEAGGPRRLLLNPSSPIQEDPQVRLMLGQPPDSPMIENLKIAYLISCVRQSPYTFIRNGDTHSSQTAAAHLSRKYRKMADKIKTAADFIRKIASRSESSGKPYLIRCEDKIYPSQDVLLSELQALEDVLTKKEF